MYGPEHSVTIKPADLDPLRSGGMLNDNVVRFRVLELQQLIAHQHPGRPGCSNRTLFMDSLFHAKYNENCSPKDVDAFIANHLQPDGRPLDR